MTSTNLDGTYSATYMAQSPNGSGGYVPQATLALFKFTRTTFHGVIQAYRGGADSLRSITVAGQYVLKHNDALKAIDGNVYVGLLPGTDPDEAAFLQQVLYVVRRKDDEFDFILVESRPPESTRRIRDRDTFHSSELGVELDIYPPNAIVQGTFKRCSH